MKKVLVTGAYGYMGSHLIKALAESGCSVTGLDNKKSTNAIEKYCDNVIMQDVTLKDHSGEFDTVVHLAALIDVAESVNQPWKYSRNNVEGTFNSLVKYKSNNFVFSSTAAAFDPVSPYAQSKLLAESIIKAFGNQYTIFRFFNIAGCSNEFSQVGKATHLVRIAAEAAAGKRPYVTINGTDWETQDGTCERDYIHIDDLVLSLLKAVEMPSNKDYDCVGSGTGYSVRQVIAAMKEVTGIDFEVREGPRRPGDVAKVLIPTGKISEYTFINKTLEDMCLSAYQAELN